MFNGMFKMSESSDLCQAKQGGLQAAAEAIKAWDASMAEF